jgi:cell division protein FtsB
VSRLLTLLLLGLLILLQIKLWVGDGGRQEVETLRQSVELQRMENAELEARNEALAAEVDDLKEGDAAIEERARTELGMIRPDEVFYRVVDPSGPLVPRAQLPADDVGAGSGGADSGGTDSGGTENAAGSEAPAEGGGQ